MKALLLPTVYGILAIKEKSKEVLDIIFQNTTIENIAENYLQLQKGNLPEELEKMCENLKEQGYSTIEVEDPTDRISLSKIDGISAVICDDLENLKIIRQNLIQLWMDAKIKFNVKDLNDRTKTLSEIMIKNQIAEISTQEDFQVKQAIDTLNDIDKSINFFSSRLREWYGLHFPELTDKLIADNIQFTRIVAKIGIRANFSEEKLINELGLNEKKAKLIIEKAKRSMGGLLSENDSTTILELAHRILDLKDYHDKLEEYVSTTLDKICPNMKTVIGAQITAKLLSIAGSLERLATMSSSTIQVLGAEKALFKAMKSGGDTPKYGVIFQWNKIRGEKSYLRGKIARMLSGKISILAKVDYHKGKFIGDIYKEMIDKKIELIQKQFPKPPIKKDFSGDKEKFHKGKFQKDRNQGDFKGRKGRSSSGSSQGRDYKSGSSRNFRSSDNRSRSSSGSNQGRDYKGGSSRNFKGSDNRNKSSSGSNQGRDYKGGSSRNFKGSDNRNKSSSGSSQNRDYKDGSSRNNKNKDTKKKKDYKK